MQNRGMLILPDLYQTWVRLYNLQTILDQASHPSLPLFPPNLLGTRHCFSGFPTLPALSLVIIIFPEIHDVTKEASVRSAVCTWPSNYRELLIAFCAPKIWKDVA